MYFKSVWIVLFGISLAYPVNATEVCRDCRSMDLQLAIDVGVEVGLDYLTSAAALPNGTTIDLVHLPGSDKYRTLMRNTAAEAEGIQDGVGASRLVQACVFGSCSPRPKSWMPWLNELGYKARWRHEYPILAYLSDHYPSVHFYLSAPPTPLLNADDKVQTLVQELTRLKARSEAELGTLINETSIFFPSITKLLGQSFAGYIRQSFHLAGFLVPTDNDGIAVQHAALSTVEITGPTLGLEYGDAALCLSMQLPNAEQPEYPHLERVGSWAALGSGFESTTGHWARLALQVIPQQAAQDFIIADIFPEIQKKSYERENPGDYNFAAARGASSRARKGMLYGGDFCMPDPSCKLADGHPWKQSREL